MNPLKNIIFTIPLILLSLYTYATPQFPDYLLYKGDTIAIHSNPLEEYFRTHERPDSIFDEHGFNLSACWRGYIAYWELKEDSLFLLEVHGDTMNIDLALIFQDRDTKKKIFADWYNHSILCPHGEIIYHMHMGYNSIYEYETEFSFSDGILVKTMEYDNTKSRKSKYTQAPILVKKFLQQNTNHSLLPDSTERAKVFVQIIKVNALGKIDSVSVVRGYNETLDKEAMRVVISIPDWDVLYKRGEIINLRWTIPVIFEKE